ncbi:MAG TPA: 23S rRNA (uracil(1939)-C(5))-methyltransferase RlmD [bacterium]|nr:23S rRNA (uracil(1939)-C(5))-methyltransferase RlmD [bacterium]
MSVQERDQRTAAASRAPRPRRGDEITLTIDRLAYGGRGVGRLDGFVVFVPDTAPGDRVRARLWRVRSGYGEADLVGIESPSHVRTAAPCPHFGPCGGCTWQHLTYDAQTAAKESIVRESLAHLGGLRDVEVRPIVRMAAPWYYRNKMEFSFHPGGIGLHRRGAFDKIVPIASCYLESPRTNIILQEVDAFARTSGLSCYDPRTHTGMLRQVVIREAKNTGEVMVALVTAAREVPGLRGLADRLRAAVPEIVSVAHGINAGPSDGVPLTDVTIVAGRPHIREILSGLTFRIGLETFFQTNTVQAEHLVRAVEADAGLRGGETVFDLYCGVGTFSLALARRAARVLGIEIVAPAIEAARENAVLNGIANAEFASGDARLMLPQILERAGRPDVLVLDPPRSGAGGRVMRKVAATGARRIVYVSCNPTTLAPDLKELIAAGYIARHAQPLDLFPHTYHVECVVLAERG